MCKMMETKMCKVMEMMVVEMMEMMEMMVVEITVNANFTPPSSKRIEWAST